MKHTINTHILPSKLRLMLIDMPNAASFDIRVYISSGYGHAPRDKYELPHLLEHLLFSGNEAVPEASDFTAAMEKITANWQGLTNYRNNYFTYSKSSDSLSDFFGLVQAQLLKPLFYQKNLAEQKEVIRQELKRQIDSDVDQCGVVSLQRAIPVLTFEERLKSLDAITLEDVETYHANMFQPNNISICVSGDMGTSSQEIIDVLSLWSGDVAKTSAISYKPIDTKQIEIQSSFKPGRSFIQFDMLKFGYNPNDMPALRALQAIWHTSKSSRFYQRIRPQGFSYSPMVSIALTHSYLRIILRDSLPDKNVIGFLSSFLEEYRNLCTAGPTEEEVIRAKRLLAERDTVNYATPQQIGDYYGEHWAMSDQPLSIDEYNDSVQALTAADISRVGKEYLENWHIVIRSGLDDSSRSEFENSISQLMHALTKL